MQRIFLGLASISILLLLANAVVGLAGGDYNAACKNYLAAKHELADLELKRGGSVDDQAAARTKMQTAKQAMDQLVPYKNAHLFLGVTAAIVTILVCSISVTYFVGTSRWSKEVVETYHLAAELAEESARIKRRSFPWAVIGMLTMVAVAGLGGAADPSGANSLHSADWVQIHFLTALASVGVIGWSFLMQGQCLTEHSQLIEKIMAEVRRIREARGMKLEPTT